MRRVLSQLPDLARAWALRHGVFALALLGLFFSTYRRSLEAHALRAENPLLFNDDARQQIFPFFQYHEAGLFPHDFAAEYYRACFPIGYRALYTVGGFVADPATISKVLPYVLLFVLVVAVAVAARRLAGLLGALVAAALVLSSELFLDRMAGGLPRSFAFPLLALAAAALALGRARLLAGVVCAGAAFYPPAAMPAGIALAIFVFVLPAKDRGEAADWSFGRRARLVAIAGGLSALILLPTLIASRGYGRTLRPADVVEYPELGPGGRYGPGDRAPFTTFPEAALEQAQGLMKPGGLPLSPRVQAWSKTGGERGALTYAEILLELLMGALLVGGAVMSARDAAGRRLFALGLAAWLGHLASRPIAPYFYLPQRYAAYPVPILLVVLIPAVAAAIGGALSLRRSARIARPLAVAVMGAMILLPFGGRGSVEAGIDNDARHQRKLYEFLGGLPKDALIAGWPTDLDNVPYVSRRRAFVTYELHQTFHQRYADEMRRRMRALIDAYFATDPGPILRLRDEFGVTHLVLQQSRLQKQPFYFKPYDAWTKKAFDAGAEKGFELKRQAPAAQVFADGSLVVLDLSRVRAGPP